MVADGEIKSYIQEIESPTTKMADKIRAIESFQRDYPDRGKKYDSLQKKLNASFEADRAENEWINRFKKSVKIGSSKHEIITNGWGYPSAVNKTTTIDGVREQWVYGEGRYLYFFDGILTAIQE
jgi:hypothetical protein